MEFEEYINRLEESLCTLGNVQTKSINYGVQIVLTAAGKKVTLNVYNGKKGISLVWGGEDSELRDQAIELVHQIQLYNNKGSNAAGAVPAMQVLRWLHLRKPFTSALPGPAFCWQKRNRAFPVSGWAATKAEKGIISVPLWWPRYAWIKKVGMRC